MGKADLVSLRSPASSSWLSTLSVPGVCHAGKGKGRGHSLDQSQAIPPASASLNRICWKPWGRGQGHRSPAGDPHNRKHEIQHSDKDREREAKGPACLPAAAPVPSCKWVLVSRPQFPYL